MVGFTKLYSSIVGSSIWSEPHHVRIVWVTLLALADSDGMVEASVGGLARFSNVTRDECDDALRVLTGPDPDSRDGTTGERVEQVPGGFLVINYVAYRERQTKAQEAGAERARRYRERNSDRNGASRSVTPRNALSRRERTEAEAEAEAEAEENQKQKVAAPAATAPASDPPRRVADRPPEVDPELWRAFLANRTAKRKPLTPRAWALIRNRIDAGGVSITEALTTAVANGWADFDPSWGVNNRGSPGNNRSRPPAAIAGLPRADDEAAIRAYYRDPDATDA